MRYQIEELKSKIEKNKSKIEKNKCVALEAKSKSEFWEKASQALNNNSLVLELRSTNQVKLI